MTEKNVLRGRKSSFPVPQENTGKFLYRSLIAKKKHEIAFINDETEENLTYGELLENSCRLAQSLGVYGNTPDMVIALCSENHVNYFTVVLAALYVGIPIALINPNYTEYELQHALNLVKPAVVFCSTACAKKIMDLKSTNPFIRKIIIIGSKTSSPEFDSLQKFIDDRSDKDLALMGFTARDVGIQDTIAFILFSSGTTGLPKGVMLAHEGVNATLASMLDDNVERPQESQIMVGILPFFHVYGLQVSLSAIYRGRQVVVLDKFEPETYLKVVEKYKISMLMTVPPLIQFLVKNKSVDQYDLSNVKEIACGAAPLGSILMEAVKTKFNLRLVRQGYGSTESGFAISFPPVEADDHPGSVGTMYPSMSAVIKDVTTGENLGPNREGEICIRGPMLMKGYYRNEKATRESYTKDGWLKTGDIGYYDRDGFLYIVDRMKELIKYNAFQVAPAELEHILLTNPKIQDAGVVGLPDEDAGELPVAFVVKQPNISLTEQEVKDYLAKFVSRHKHLHGGVIFVDEIPRNPSGKILRRELRKLLTSLKSKL